MGTGERKGEKAHTYTQKPAHPKTSGHNNSCAGKADRGIECEDTAETKALRESLASRKNGQLLCIPRLPIICVGTARWKLETTRDAVFHTPACTRSNGSPRSFGGCIVCVYMYVCRKAKNKALCPLFSDQRPVWIWSVRCYRRFPLQLSFRSQPSRFVFLLESLKLHSRNNAR